MNLQESLERLEGYEPLECRYKFLEAHESKAQHSISTTPTKLVGIWLENDKLEGDLFIRDGATEDSALVLHVPSGVSKERLNATFGPFVNRTILSLGLSQLGVETNGLNTLSIFFKD